VRALSVALGIDWETAYALAALNGYLMNDVISADSVWGSVLRQNGFYRHAIPNSCPECFTIGDFAEEHPHGVYVVGTGTHVVTVKDGIIWDSWDSSQEIPQYYWHKEEKR
jgi:hypothetical protein